MKKEDKSWRRKLITEKKEAVDWRKTEQIIKQQALKSGKFLGEVISPLEVKIPARDIDIPKLPPEEKLQEFIATYPKQEEVEALLPGSLLDVKEQILQKQSLEEVEITTSSSEEVAHSDFDLLWDMLSLMIMYSPGTELSEKLLRELIHLGKILIREVKAFGVGIIIFPKEKLLTEIKVNEQLLFPPGSKTHDGRPGEIVRGIYNSHQRVIAIAEELVTGEPGGTATHEFAHAYDDAWKKRNVMKFGLSVYLWNQFYHDRTFITHYASTKPAEYFAESLQAYFNPEKKELLKEYDPKMYAFITNLIAGKKVFS